MITETKKVYAVVVTYNGMQWIEKCFGSLQKSTVPVHIIAVDNASSDNTVSTIKEKFPDVEIIESPENVGFGRANNIGLKKVLDLHVAYAFLLNQDAWVNPDTIGNLMQLSEENKQYGIISPYHLNYEGTGPEQYFNDFVLTQYTDNFQEDKNNNMLKPVYESKFVHAACWLLPIETIQTVGGFDPLFFHYGEDNDYVQRVQFKNKSVGIVPASFVYHYGTNEGLKKTNENLNFLISQTLLQMKNPKASSLGALLLFLKQYASSITSSGNSVKSRAYHFNFRRIFKILKSRIIQHNKMAYLTEN